MKEITIYDIAKKLKLAPSTVSRAIGNNKRISKATRKRVQDAATDMGYRVNNHARNLRTESGSRLIGVIFHKLNSQFSINALYGLERYVRAAGYDIIIGHSSESHEQEVHNAENLFQRRVDGLVVGLSSDEQNMEHFTRYIDNEIPVVMFDRVKADFPGIKIVIDNFKAAYDATTHLLQQGCRRIVHIAGKQSSEVYRGRLNGYKKALDDFGLPFLQELVLMHGLEAEAVPLLVNDILALDPLPDAVFAVNDFCAALCMKALLRAGIKIPKDMAFVGFNNDAISLVIEPNLTTVDYSGMAIGEMAGKSIISQIEERQGNNTNLIITMEAPLLVRESSLRK